MKLNEEELSITPSTPRYAKDHMDIFRNAEGYLDQFLDVDKDLKRFTFKDHNDWIQSYKREKEDHPTFFIKYWKKVVGLIMFREAYFMGGVGHSNPAISLTVYSHLYKGELAKSMGDVEKKIAQKLIRVNTEAIQSETARI